MVVLAYFVQKVKDIEKSDVRIDSVQLPIKRVQLAYLSPKFFGLPQMPQRTDTDTK